MKYALNLADDGRVLSVTYEQFAPADAVLVDDIPDGNTYEYRYVAGEFIHEPIPDEPADEAPSKLDIIEAQVTYTAMMTDTLLEA